MTVLSTLNEFTKRVGRRGWFLDLAGDNVILLAGSGRSGTTWIEEVIDWRQDHRVMFEPFWGKRVPICTVFHRYQYIQPADCDPRFVAPARAIFTGRLRNPWVDAYTRASIYKRRLVKEIRANMYLAWIRQHFPRLKMVFLMRHPGAVVASMREAQWSAPDVLEFLDQPMLVDDHLHPFVDIIKNATDDFDKRVVYWCVMNLVPLAQLKQSDAHVVFYEDTVLRPAETLRSLFAFLGMPYDPAVLASVEKPSAKQYSGTTARGTSAHRRIDAWRENTSTEHMACLRSRLHAFGLDRVYSASPSEPRVRAAELLRS
jgi:hypothetical protein